MERKENLFQPPEYPAEMFSEYFESVKAKALRVSEIEAILGDDYDLDRLRELVDADRDGRCIVLPLKEGNPVWKIILRHQMWEEQLWHDAKTDPPKAPGLYYGKIDNTNSMYACRYQNGTWVLDMYPQQKMDIVHWADYTAFVREDD